jgi:hypothetical protein
MSAPIDVDFSKKHYTKQEKNKKNKAKTAATPKIKLKPPTIIKGNIAYLDRWKDILKLYSGTELLNALDADMLGRYVIEKYNLEKLYLMRDDGEVQNNVELMLKVETRIEAKTKLLNQMALSLYMTPRARAGAVPKEPEKPEDDPNAQMFN